MMGSDTFEAAQKATEKFKDKRVKQFYDQHQLAGKALAKSLGHEGKVAWDIYLFYPVKSLWEELPPPPEAYMHQLPDSWADQRCLFEKNLLRNKLAETVKRLFQ